jgi:hypothetical protein
MWVSVASARSWVFVGANFAHIFLEDLTKRLLVGVWFIRHHSESLSTISPHHFTDIFDCVCISRGWRTPLLGSSWRFSRPSSIQIQMPLKIPCTRESIVTISLFHQLESFSSCFARLETKLNVLSVICTGQNLNTTEHERQERSGLTYTGKTIEESVYMDKLKHVPACF